MVGVSQQRAGEHEEVVELELPAPASCRGLAQGELRQLPGEAAHHELGESRRGGGDEVAECLHLVAHRVDRALRRANSPSRPCFTLPFGVPVLSRRSCSYSSGAATSCVVPRDEVVEQPEQLVVGRAAGAHDRLELGQRLDHRGDRALERRRVGLGTHALGDEVPVGVARQRQGAQHGEGGVGVEREQERPLEGRVVEHLVDESGPALLERELGGDVVEHLDPRREPRLDGVLGEEALREGVQGGHRGPVELVERRGGAGGRDGVVAVGRLVERATDPVA